MAIWTTNLLCWPQWTQPRQSWEVARRSSVKFGCRSSGWEGEAGGKDGTQRWGKGQTFYGPGSKYKIDTTKPVTDMIVKVTLRQKSRCHEECCTNHELERIVAVDKDCLWGCQGVRQHLEVYCSQITTLSLADPTMRSSTVGLRSIRCCFLRAIHGNEGRRCMSRSKLFPRKTINACRFLLISFVARLVISKLFFLYGHILHLWWRY